MIKQLAILKRSSHTLKAVVVESWMVSSAGGQRIFEWTMVRTEGSKRQSVRCGWRGDELERHGGSGVQTWGYLNLRRGRYFEYSNAPRGVGWEKDIDEDRALPQEGVCDDPADPGKDTICQHQR